MKSIVFAALLLAAAPSLVAAYAARDLVVPVAGRAVGADGRAYVTALWITNASDRPADVAMTFYSAAHNVAPLSSALQLAAGETRLLDPYDPGVSGTGWIRIRSARELLATAHVYSRMTNETNAHAIAATYNAIPARFAITNGESATLQGVTPADARYKLFFDEVAGQPLEVWVALIDLHGTTIARTHVYIDSYQQVVKDAAELFPAFTSGAAIVRVEGMHGRGRVVVTGSATAKVSQDSSEYEMSFTPAARDRMSNAEVAAYIACAAGVLAAVVARRR